MRSELFKVFPFVEATMQSLKDQNKLLNKVTLTGKINALDVASTLFEFTDNTMKTFNTLQNELVAALIEENLHKLQSELHSKAQIAIDILIRNLFERTADVGFLATDTMIIDFLLSDTVSFETMRERLKEYAAKYTVYNEIVVFDTQGNVKVNMNPDNTFKTSNDPILKEALESESYIERYAHSDIFATQNKTLTYVQKISAHHKPIGVLCLCFRFEDELQRILNGLATPTNHVAIADNTGILGCSSVKHKKQFPTYRQSDYQLIEGKRMAVTVKSNGYQGYEGITSWYAVCMGGNTPTETAQSLQNTHNDHALLSDNLRAIIEKADDLVEDLSDVIINGELIASKRKVYILHPILDNLRFISTSLLETIKSSVTNLEATVEASLINDAKMAAHLAVDIMDRNLYERANDCRWWALTPLFEDELSSPEPNSEAMCSTLSYINNLYTVYTNLFIFDTNGSIVAASHDRSIITERINNSFIQKVLRNSNTQHYFVSDFEPCRFYNERPTYVYGASIKHNGRVVGGIGIIFDSEVEFKAMLNDSFPTTQEGFALFVDSKKQIIASNTNLYQPLQTLEIDDKFFNTKAKHAIYDYITLNERRYIVSSAYSKGYREYKISDNYKNDVFALIFVSV